MDFLEKPEGRRENERGEGKRRGANRRGEAKGEGRIGGAREKGEGRTSKLQIPTSKFRFAQKRISASIPSAVATGGEREQNTFNPFPDIRVMC
jgi:hypothetical protein